MSCGAIRNARLEFKLPDRTDICDLRDVHNMYWSKPFDFIRDVSVTHHYTNSKGRFTAEFLVILLQESLFELIEKFQPNMMWLVASAVKRIHTM